MTFSILVQMIRKSTLFAIVMGLLVAGCGAGQQEREASSNATVGIVATTTQVADMARNVGGDGVEVTGLLTANADPHDYEVRPQDIESLSSAELVVRSGGDIDEWLTEAIEGSGTEAPLVNLIDHVRTIESGAQGDGDQDAHGEDKGHADVEEANAEEEAHADGEEGVDPHWWQDPQNTQRAVSEIRDALTAADPAGRQTYARNADAYLSQLMNLDAGIEACMRRVPEDQRKLVTTHDSLGYYANRYGLEVIGTVIPSLSSQGQPSAGEAQKLIETIEHQGVKAIFTERAVNPTVERAIAEETGAKIKALWADTLGRQDSNASTYVDALAADTRVLVDGFTGGEVACTLPS